MTNESGYVYFYLAADYPLNSIFNLITEDLTTTYRDMRSTQFTTSENERVIVKGNHLVTLPRTVVYMEV